MLPSLPVPGSRSGTALPPAERERARKPRRFRVRWRWVLALLLLGAALLCALLLLEELRTSEFQARKLAELAREATFRLEPGPSPSIRFPDSGPYDERLGYTGLPDFIARLVGSGFEIESQAQHSPRLEQLEDWGISPAYREKDRAGLRIVGRDGAVLFGTRFPEHTYERFEDVPKLVVDALVFVENREVLDDRYPRRNPAVEWDRLGRAALSRALQVAGAESDRSGGSTLATQIEKFRHSPRGLTSSPGEKLRQMASASLRAYQDGENTTAARRRIVLDYVNSIPLAAAPPRGEVIGLGDALSIWYGADFERTNEILRTAADPRSPHDLETRARAYKRALSLVLSAGRPSYYLIQDPKALAVRTDTYLRLLAEAGRSRPICATRRWPPSSTCAGAARTPRRFPPRSASPPGPCGRAWSRCSASPTTTRSIASISTSRPPSSPRSRTRSHASFARFATPSARARRASWPRTCSSAATRRS